jgi:leucyl-tRNA synthetase
MVGEEQTPQRIDFLSMEQKWEKEWGEKKIFAVSEDSEKEKCYVLEMYPYPSASFLHMGHVRCYTIGDIFARFKRMSGYNVLYPIGYDSFGLPAETAAKKEGVHPRSYAEGAIKKIMEYQKALGNSYDWDRVLASHEPDYYKWNQYFFIKLFEKGLAYRKKAPVNWCPNCLSVLANEEAEGGKCWRCDGEVIKKDMEQWFLKITDYADELLTDLDKIEWPERIKVMQRNWIGKSHGTEVLFKINGKNWPVFTTRPDTIFGVTFVVISAQHPQLMHLVTPEKKKEVEEFVKRCQRARTPEEVEGLDKDGVFTGSYAINPVTGEEVPVWAGNFVVADYGSGMVMAVSAHDQRDFEFAKKYRIPIKLVIQPKGKTLEVKSLKNAFVDEGVLVNSKEFNGLDNTKAISEITNYLSSKKLGGPAVNYKIRDWLVSRQRYWGTPIPMIYCDKCGVVAVPEKDLPVLLPEKVDFKSAGNPLNSNKEFVNTKCPKCGGSATRETDTMGGFVDSSWYFLRYCDSKNKSKPFDSKKVKYWMPVDQYIGGAEHAVMHLIYARFFIKALRDLGYVDFDEPFQKLYNQGIVYKDGAKMSKSKGNAVFQTDISNKYGIDTARLFLMFVSSPDKQMEWSDEGVEGAYRIIMRFMRVSEKVKQVPVDKKTQNKLSITIRDVTKTIEVFDYPKAIIAISNLLDYLNDLNEVPKRAFEDLLKLVSPFCPHVAEELWHKIGNKDFVSLADWPKFDESKIDENLERIDTKIELLRSDIIRVKELAKLQKISKVKLFVAPEWKWSALEIVKRETRTRPDFGAVMKALMSEATLRKYGGDIPTFVKTAMNKLSEFSNLEKYDEFAVLNEAKPALEKEFGSVEIIRAESSNEPKAKNAFPGKPALLIE